jgi:type II secretory pathway predicted ATPase ExeA
MNHIAFKSFLASTGLSTRRFGDLCGIGKSTVHRLAQPLHGGLTGPYVRRITPAVMDACRRHLESAGTGAGEIHRHLTEIFGDDFRPMINHRTLLTPEVLDFFGLQRDPFAAPRFPCELFTTPAIESVYAQLEQAVRCQGFVCLLAPVGAGKTMLKNRLIAELSPKSQVSKVPNEASEVNTSTRSTANVTTGAQASLPAMNAQRSKDLGPGTWDLGLKNSILLSPRFADFSRLTAAGIVAYVLEELGVKPRRALVLAQKQLEQRLAHLAANNITVALCFDECHHLNDTLLTALKNFYELGTGGFERYLGLILFGQPQFAVRLELPRFREIAERLACLELSAFTVETAENYLAHCLNNARYANPASPRSQVPKVPDKSLNIDSAQLEPGTWDLGPTSNPKSAIPNPKSIGPGVSATGCTSPHVSKGESADANSGCTSPRVSKGESADANSECTSPRVSKGESADANIGCTSPRVSRGALLSRADENPKSQFPNPKSLFEPAAIHAITARASTPLGIANAASAAMLEAYKKGERCVLARFVGESTGPRALRVGR